MCVHNEILERCQILESQFLFQYPYSSSEYENPTLTFFSMSKNAVKKMCLNFTNHHIIILNETQEASHCLDIF